MAQIRIVVTIDAESEGQAKAIGEAMKAEAGRKAAEPGALQFEVFQSLVNPKRLVVHEHWESLAAFDKHWASVLEREGVPSGPNGQFPKCELYQYTTFVIEDGVWTPREPQQRSKAIRWG